jgi:hypothetical protein
MRRKIEELQIQNEILHSTIQDITKNKEVSFSGESGLVHERPRILGVDRATSP